MIGPNEEENEEVVLSQIFIELENEIKDELLESKIDDLKKDIKEYRIIDFFKKEEKK